MTKLTIIFFLALFSFPGSAVAQDEPIKFLFIGNSYTHYNNMPSIFEKIAKSKKENVEVLMSARSSHTFKMHSERTDLYEDIRKEKWDYVILQGFSRELSHPMAHIDSASIPYLGRLLDSIYNNNPCTNVRLFMTWGYKDGIDYRQEANSYEKMADLVKTGYKYVSDAFSIPIVPVGDAWKDVRHVDPTIELYQKDGQHPTIQGSYLIACTFYAALFNASPYKGFSNARIRRRDARLIQKTTFAHINSAMGAYNLLENTYSIIPKKKRGDREVTCNANYPNANSINWDFGDGSTSSSASVRHVYEEKGKYLVKLTVMDRCGRRREMETIVFKK